MRISENYGLPRSQAALDFVDVDIHGDTRLFVDPLAFRPLNSRWAHECVSLIQDFFTEVIGAIRAGRDNDAVGLLSGLREPNEAHLGLSAGVAQGSGVGENLAHDLWSSLRESRAVQTGLLVDLEDTALMVRGIDKDRVSDIAINIIREPLIRYTQAMCQHYGIPLVAQVESGSVWDPNNHRWHQGFVDLPVADGGKLLLVPKVVVRRRLGFRQDEYYTHYILPFLEEEEIRQGGPLVGLLRDGRPKVLKKDLRAKYGEGKGTIVDVTLQHPELLDQYREAKQQRPDKPLDHEDFVEPTGAEGPDWDALLGRVAQTPRGSNGAGEFHAAVMDLLTALFYPQLTFPVKEREINEGRKRIDIVYANDAIDGFFAWLAQHYRAPYVFVECKNYSQDLGNPELDQLLGRFSNNRGEVGILVCRGFQDKDRFIQRCRDAADAGRGYVIPLDDDDLTALVEARSRGNTAQVRRFLNERFERLIL